MKNICKVCFGYNVPTNTYKDMNYYNMGVNQNIQEINELYPEIYGIVYPVVQKVCSRRVAYGISKDQIEQMTDEVYNVIEPKEEEPKEVLKNGDVRNPRAKDTRAPKQNNYLLRDLIKILIIRELISCGSCGNNVIGGGMPMTGMPRAQVMHPRNMRIY